MQKRISADSAGSPAAASTAPSQVPVNVVILTLDSHGVPHRWVSWQQACFYYAKNLVAWTLGEHTFEFFLRNKRAEWADYRNQVSAFELDRYLPRL